MEIKEPTVETQTPTAEAPATQPAEQRATPALPAQPKKQNYVAEGFKNRTQGEAVFNLSAYAGVGYFGVTAFSVFMSWLLRDHKPAAKQFDKVGEWAVNTFKGKREGEALTKFTNTVNSNLTIGALFTGGTLMSVLPIKWLEDNKAKLVSFYDEKFYGKERAESDPTIVAAHKDLETAPHQTWLSVVSSRVLAFVATFGTSLLMGATTSPVARATGHSLDKFSTHAGRWLDGAVHNNKPAVLKQIDAARGVKPHDIVRSGPAADRVSTRVFSYISLDAVYTLITGGALYIFTRVLAPVFDQQHKQKRRDLENAPPEQPLVSAVPSLPAPDAKVPAASISNAALEGRMESPASHVALA